MGSQQFFEKLDIFGKEKTISDFTYKSEYVLKRKSILAKILKINFIKKFIFLKKNIIKKKFLTDFFFKQKHWRKQIVLLSPGPPLPTSRLSEGGRGRGKRVGRRHGGRRGLEAWTRASSLPEASK